MKVPLAVRDHIDRAVAVYPDRIAVVDEPGQPVPPMTDLTFRRLGEQMDAQGAALDRLGVQFGTRLAMVSHNVARVATSCFGTSGNGRISVRMVVAGAPPPARTIERMDAELAREFVQMYGLTETASVEVEDAVLSHPEVAEAAVIGVPEAEWGETIEALVVPAAVASTTSEELIELCRWRIARDKCPTTIEFRDELARTPTGILQKFTLREPYWRGSTRQVN